MANLSIELERKNGRTTWLTSALLLSLSFAGRALARDVVVPNLVAHSIGIGGVLWGSELRVTNLTGAVLSLRVKDWIGTPGWQPSTISVPAFSAISIGGWDVFSPNLASAVEDHPEPVFGAAVLDVDDGLAVQSAILAGRNPPILITLGGGRKCPGFLGGYFYRSDTTGNCNTGGGPVTDAVSDFFPASEQVDLLWLSTDVEHRTNISFINPDAGGATMLVRLVSANGLSAQDLSVFVPARGIAQITDVFRNAAPAVRAANDLLGMSAARAHISSSTRFFATAYVISNDNNTVGISLPRVGTP